MENMNITVPKEMTIDEYIHLIADFMSITSNISEKLVEKMNSTKIKVS